MCQQLDRIWIWAPHLWVSIWRLNLSTAQNDSPGGGGGTGPNFDGGVALVNAKTHPYLRETKGPDKPHV